MSIQFKVNKRFGLVVRTFSPRSKDVPKRVEAVEELVSKLPLLTFSQDVFVWEGLFPKTCSEEFEKDCGKTFASLQKNRVISTCAKLHRFMSGGLYSGILNYAIAHQLRQGIDYSLIVSTEAIGYVTAENIVAMIEAVEMGAKAAGIAIKERSDLIMSGRLSNHICMWDNLALMSVGGFDLRAENPVFNGNTHYVCGRSEDGSEVFSPIAGAAEMVPLVRLVEAFGPCIAPIRPTGNIERPFTAPNPETDREQYLRHVCKLATVSARQEDMLSSIGSNSKVLEEGVMPEYAGR
jgi:hypothetical protein